jgi:hypothetical protein
MCDHDQASRSFLFVPNVDRLFSQQILQIHNLILIISSFVLINDKFKFAFHFIRQSDSEISLEKNMECP